MSFDFPGLKGHVFDDDILKIDFDPITGKSKLLGCGTFGAVFKGELRQIGKPNVSVAVKVHHPGYVPEQHVPDEYIFLQMLGGKHNVIQMLTHIYDAEKKIVHFVYPFFEETPFLSFVVDATEDEIKAYMRTLLTALAWLHLHNIMHVDIKWSNFLFNRVLKDGKLIDLGCARYMNELTEGCTRDPKKSGDYVSGPSLFYRNAIKTRMTSWASEIHATLQTPEFMLPHKRRNGTPGFKPLESLIGSDLISSAVDIFAAGSILILLLLRKKEFFIQDTPADGIMEFCKLYGAHKVAKVALQLGKKITIKLNTTSEIAMRELSSATVKEIFQALRQNCGPNSFSQCAFELLAILLALHPARRATAAFALKHPFLI